MGPPAIPPGQGLAQARLAYRNADRKFGSLFALVFCLGPDRNRDLERYAHWREVSPPFGCGAVTNFLLEESRRRDHCERAWERSAVLGFAMEATVAVQQGREAVVRLMEAGGDRFMEARVGHEAAGEAGYLIAVRRCYSFLCGLRGEGGLRRGPGRTGCGTGVWSLGDGTGRTWRQSCERPRRYTATS